MSRAVEFDSLNRPYVTIHGPDGVGKTTIGRNLAATLHNVGQWAVFFRDWRASQGHEVSFDPYVNRASPGSISRDFVLAQAAHTATQSTFITALTGSGFTVVQDRSILDDRACLHAEGLNPAAHLEPSLREPDLAIFLAVSERERAKRLAVRPSTTPYSQQPNIAGSSAGTITNHILGQVETLAADDRGVIIDTDHVGIQKVTDRIVEEMRARNLLVPAGQGSIPPPG